MYRLLNFTKFIGLSANAQFRVYSSHSIDKNKTSIKYSKSGFDKFALKYEGEITLSVPYLMVVSLRLRNLFLEVSVKL